MCALGESTVSVDRGLPTDELADRGGANPAGWRSACGTLESCTGSSAVSIEHAAFQLRVRDLNTALSFYQEALKAEVLGVYEGFYAFIRLGSAEIHLKCVEDVDPGIAYVQAKEHVTVYCWTSSIQAVLESFTREPSGGRLVRDAEQTPWQTLEAVLEDPDGHRIYVAERLADSR